MKRRLTASAVRSAGARRNEEITAGHAPAQGPRPRAGGGRIPPTHGEARPELTSVKAWTHTLVLTGELSHRTAHILESEIEQLCEEGVTGIRLDLRGLTSVDPIGAAVIAFRSNLCKRRGYEFTLIRGQRAVQRVLEQAEVAEVLTFEEHELFAAARLPAAPVVATRARDSREQP